MDVLKEQVAELDGQPVIIISLQNDQGAVVNVLTYGATIKDILLPGSEPAKSENMVLSYDTAEEYFTDRHYIGSTVGRFANRIAGGRLHIGGNSYQLTRNEEERGNHLHGGYRGFNKKLWQIKDTFIEESACGVTLSLLNSHLEEGYPGNLQTNVSFIFSNANELVVRYKASTDRPTIVSLTNHSYFNLSGGKRNISTHSLTINADEFTPASDKYIPYGNVESVAHSIYDLRSPRLAAEFMKEVDTLNYCLNNKKQLKLAAVLSDPESDRTLEVSTTCPGLQLYCGNYLNGKFAPFDGICLEPDYYPDSPNQPQFPSSLLMPGQIYDEVSSYKFR